MNPKKALTLLLALFCLMTLLALPVDAATNNETDFVPVLRFVASSDTHVTGDGDVRTQRIGKMLDEAYAIANGDSNYKALDAVLVVGDLTEDGTPAQFEAFENAFARVCKATQGCLRWSPKTMTAITRAAAISARRAPT